MRCIHCGQVIEYKMPDPPFVGGWVGEDGWGLVCAVPPFAHHEPSPPTVEGEGWSISVLGNTDRIIG